MKIDRAYVLNLDTDLHRGNYARVLARFPESLQAVTRRLVATNGFDLPGGDAVRQARLPQFVSKAMAEFNHGMVRRRCVAPGLPFYFTPGQVGYTISAVRALIEAERDGCEVVAMFDDDAKPEKNFERELERALTEVPDDWEVLMLGMYPNYDRNYGGKMYPVPGTSNICTATGATKCMYGEEGGAFIGSYAYLVRRPAFQKIARRAFPMTEPYDDFLGKLAKKGRVRAYVVCRRIVRTDFRESTTAGTTDRVGGRGPRGKHNRQREVRTLAKNSGIAVVTPRGSAVVPAGQAVLVENGDGTYGHSHVTREQARSLGLRWVRKSLPLSLKQ